MIRDVNPVSGSFFYPFRIQGLKRPRIADLDPQHCLDLLTWDTWGGVSRSPCRRVVDTYWHLCGQPFFLPLSHILLKILGLLPVFWSMILFSFLISSSVAAAWAVLWSLQLDILQQFFERLLTVRRSCSLWKTIPVLNCPYCKRVFSDVRRM